MLYASRRSILVARWGKSPSTQRRDYTYTGPPSKKSSSSHLPRTGRRLVMHDESRYDESHLCSRSARNGGALPCSPWSLPLPCLHPRMARHATQLLTAAGQWHHSRIDTALHSRCDTPPHLTMIFSIDISLVNILGDKSYHTSDFKKPNQYQACYDSRVGSNLRHCSWQHLARRLSNSGDRELCQTQASLLDIVI